MTQRRHARPVAAAALVALALAGCEADTPGKGDTSSSGSVTSPSSSSTSAPTTRAAAGATPVGAKFDWGRYESIKPYLTQLAGSSTFYEAVWCDIEKTQGQPDWSAIDNVAKRSQEVGITLMLKIRTGRCWATGGGDSQYKRGSKNKTESMMPADLSAYEKFVTSMVKRYAAQGVHVYAVENEINSPSFWGGSTDDYVTLAKAASKAVRAADPQAKIVDPGLSSTTYGAGAAQRLLDAGKDDEAVLAYNTYFERRFGTRGDKLLEVANAKELQDQLAVSQNKRNVDYLNMVQKLYADKVVDIRQVHYYETPAGIPFLWQYLRATTPSSMPIEIWEMGQFKRGRALTDQQSMSEMVRGTSMMLGRGAAKVLWLPLLPQAEGRNSDEPRTGLLDPKGAVRPLGKMYARIAADARGAAVASVGGDDLDGVTLTRGGQDVSYVWPDSGSKQVEAASGSVTNVIDGAKATQVTPEAPIRAQVTVPVQEVIR